MKLRIKMHISMIMQKRFLYIKIYILYFALSVFFPAPKLNMRINVIHPRIYSKDFANKNFSSLTQYPIVGFLDLKNHLSLSTVSPTSLSYSQTQYTFTQGISISPVIPTISGSITECGYSFFTPRLNLENTSCTLSGTPSVGTALTDYKITANNAAGSVSTTISIRTIFGSAKFAYA